MKLKTLREGQLETTHANAYRVGHYHTKHCHAWGGSTPNWFRHRKYSEAEGRGIGLIEARRNLSELARVSQNTEESPSPRMPAPILKGAINYLRGRPGGKRLNSKPQDPLDRTYHGGYPPQEWAEPQADADPTNTFFDGIRDSFATPSSSPQLFSTDVSQPVTTG